MIAQPGIHFDLSFDPAITWFLPCILTGSIHLLTRLLVSISRFQKKEPELMNEQAKLYPVAQSSCIA
jgi:hypothetical protein